ncbi:MAG: hypothetical protein ABI678_03775 [Kofleriaceae bacterium]
MVRQTLAAFAERHAFSEMHSDYHLTWKAFSLEGAIKSVMSRERMIGLRTGDETVQAAISRTKQDTFTTLILTSCAVEPTSLDDELVAVTRTLDQLTWANAMPDPSEIWIALRGHPRPPPPFELPVWLSIVHPRWYESRISRERLLAAPVRVEERDGAIWMWTYDDPLHYDNDDAIEAMKRLALYLREHVRA